MKQTFLTLFLLAFAFCSKGQNLVLENRTECDILVKYYANDLFLGCPYYFMGSRIVPAYTTITVNGSGFNPGTWTGQPYSFFMATATLPFNVCSSGSDGAHGGDNLNCAYPGSPAVLPSSFTIDLACAECTAGRVVAVTYTPSGPNGHYLIY